MFISLAWSSLLSRRKTVVLTFLSLLISIMVLFSVEHIRTQAKESFSRTISGVDLIVGAPSGQLNLLLYSVFRMGNPTNSISFESVDMLQNHELVEWLIPIALGDSHRGFRVMGTTDNYFQHYKYANEQRISFKEGKAFNTLFEAVIGWDVAQKLNYQVGDKIVIAHGIGSVSFKQHDYAPFIVSGILAPTGTPIDKTVHIHLTAIDVIHMPPNKLREIIHNQDAQAPKPSSVTAVMLGLTSKFATFKMQRDINNYKNDRLMAVLPGVAITELWQLMASIENLLRIIAVLVLISSLFGVATMLLATMDQRKSEFAVLRVLGASPILILCLILLEAFILVCLALFSAGILLSLFLTIFSSWLASEFGLFLSANIFSKDLFVTTTMVLVATLITAIYPAIEAYRKAISSDLSAN